VESGKGNRRRDAREPLASELITALEAELAEERERTARLEDRVRRLEGQLAPSVPDEADHASRVPVEPVVKALSIDSWHWDEGDERAYWLRRCEGFRVSDYSGVLGHVDSIRFEHELEKPDTLVVLNKRWPRRQCEIPVSDIAEITPERHEITLAVPLRDWLLPPRPNVWSRIRPHRTAHPR
jgi:hypothetical protein